MPFGENVGSSHVATGTIGWNLRPLSRQSGSPATDCLMLGHSSLTEISAKIPVRDFFGQCQHTD